MANINHRKWILNNENLPTKIRLIRHESTSSSIKWIQTSAQWAKFAVAWILGLNSAHLSQNMITHTEVIGIRAQISPLTYLWPWIYNQCLEPIYDL